MGQKVNPIGFRLGVNRDWRSRWYASPQELPAFLHSDLEIRNYVKKKLQFAAVSKIVIERAWNSIRVTIHTARPGIVIGRKGAEIEKMTEEISKMAQGKQIKIDIQEIKTPELDAQLVAENVALQIERRIAYRRAMKKAVQTAMDFGARRNSTALLGPIERRGNLPLGMVSRGQGTAAHFADRNRLRIRRSEHGLRQDRREMLDVSERRSATEPAGPALPPPPPLVPERSLGGIHHAVDAQTSEVSQVPAGKPQGDSFAQSANRFWRVRAANARARVDHKYADRGRASRADPQHEAQRQIVDPDFP